MPPSSNDTDHTTLDPDQWVDRYGDHLYHFALERLRSATDAETAVQETFMAAWRSRAAFSGTSVEHAWLMGILKHKINDQIRAYYRTGSPADIIDEQEAIRNFFDQPGRFKKNPSAWTPEPAILLQKENFWDVFKRCKEKLPAATRDAFLLRDLDGLDDQTICEILNITRTSLWAMLYRARLQVRQCLEINWFENERKQ